MKPLEAAARFAAFIWYTGYCSHPSANLAAKARHFSKENWQSFLPAANVGWGKLLLRIAKVRANSPDKKPSLAATL